MWFKPCHNDGHNVTFTEGVNVSHVCLTVATLSCNPCTVALCPSAAGFTIVEEKKHILHFLFCGKSKSTVECRITHYQLRDQNHKTEVNQGLYTTWRGGVGLESLWNTLLFVNVCFCPRQQKTKEIEKFENIENPTFAGFHRSERGNVFFYERPSMLLEILGTDLLTLNNLFCFFPRNLLIYLLMCICVFVYFVYLYLWICICVICVHVHLPHSITYSASPPALNCHLLRKRGHPTNW